MMIMTGKSPLLFQQRRGTIMWARDEKKTGFPGQHVLLKGLGVHTLLIKNEDIMVRQRKLEIFKTCWFVKNVWSGVDTCVMCVRKICRQIHWKYTFFGVKSRETFCNLLTTSFLKCDIYYYESNLIYSRSLEIENSTNIYKTHQKLQSRSFWPTNMQFVPIDIEQTQGNNSTNYVLTIICILFLLHKYTFSVYFPKKLEKIESK